MPAAVVEQRILDHADGLEVRQKLEQRVRGPRHEHLVTGVAEQFEEVRVGFAGARREGQAVAPAR